MKTLRELRAAVAADLARATMIMAVTLLTWGFSLLVETRAEQHVDLVVLAVAIAVTLARTESERPSHPVRLPLLVLPAATAGASYLAGHLARAQHVADAGFVLAIGLCLWGRRFGAGWSKVGTVASLPLVATLVTPYVPQPDLERAGWSAAEATVAVLLTLLARAATRRWDARVTAPRLPIFAPAPAAGPAREPVPSGFRYRPPPSSRMAAQMVVALALGFLIGRNLIDPVHWQWPVLTAYIVGSGNQGRADVVYKALQRGVGAAGGTVVASLLSDQFGRGDKVAVALIFVILWISLLLRRASYAYWAASITAALALVYGYFGSGGTTILEHRLEGIGLGAVAGVAAAWLILPIRTVDVFRRRLADLLAVLQILLETGRDRPQEVGAGQVRPVLVAVAAMSRIMPPLDARARLLSLVGMRDRIGGVSAALAECDSSVRAFARLVRASPVLPGAGPAAAEQERLLANLRLVRASLRSRQAVATTAVARPGGTGAAAEDARLREVLARLDGSVLALGRAAVGGAPFVLGLDPRMPGIDQARTAHQSRFSRVSGQSVRIRRESATTGGAAAEASFPQDP